MALIGVIADASASPLGALSAATSDTCCLHELHDALALEHDTDAHLVGYIVNGHDGQPMQAHARLAPGDEAQLFAKGYNTVLGVLVADVAIDSAAAPPATALWYRDGDRLRIVQPLSRVIDIEQADAVAAAWLTGLALAGLHPLDPPDWTRAYRLPNTTRGGFPFVSQLHGAGTPIAPPVAASIEIAPSAPAPPAVAKQLHDALRACREGWTIIKVPPGAGKTQAFCDLALDRAKTKHGPNATTLRAPPHSKSSLLLPRNALACEKTDQVRARGGDVQRLHGMASAVVAAGRGCRWPNSLPIFSAAGQSARRTLCDGGSDKRRGAPCEHRSSCDTYKSEGVDGDPAARFAIGPQSMGPQLAAHAGTTGLLGIDDPPATVLDPHLFTAEELDAAAKLDERDRPPFEPAYGALAAVFRHLAAWLHTSPPAGDLFVLADIVPAELLEKLEDLYAGRRIEAILKSTELILLRQTHHRGAPLGEAMKMARVLGDALRRKHLCAMVEESDGKRILRTFGIAEWFERVIVGFQGTGILLGADADLHYPILCKLLACPPVYIEIPAPDGAPISRRVMPLRAAGPSRSIFDGKKFRLSPAILRAVEWSIDWALEGPTADGVLIVTRKPLRLVLEAAAPSTTAERRAAIAQVWIDEVKQTAEAFDQAVRALAPLLARLGSAPLGFAHFGATRGLDLWSSFDASITIGDPWLDVGHVKLEAVFLHGNAHDTEALRRLETERSEAYVAAELEQAHGRLRVVYRTKPGRMLHIGRITPRGWEGRCVIDAASKGRPKNRAKTSEPDLDVELEEIRAHVVELGGQHAAARAIGIPQTTLSNYVKGRPAPLAARLALRAAVAGRFEADAAE